MSGSASFERGSIEVVRAHAKLAGAVAAVGAQAFAEAFAAHNAWSDLVAHLERRYAPGAVAARAGDPACAYFLARDVRGPVGMALLEDGPPSAEAVLLRPLPPGAAAQLREIYVLARARSAGAGARLLAAAVAEARRRGASCLWLGVWSENPRAVRFYERHGFAIVGSHTFVLGNDAQRDHVMARGLRE